MALVLNDRVKETTTTTGTGTVNLAGAETGFETFVAGIGNSNTCYYAIVHQSAAEFEVGLGTVTDASPDTLARTTVISSSNSDSAVNFSAGTKDVFCTLPASKAVFIDGSGDLEFNAPGDDFSFKNSSNTIAFIKTTNNDFTIQNNLNDKDFILKGYDADGGGLITGLTIDYSNAGQANFNKNAAFGTTTVDPLGLVFTGTGVAINEDSGTAFMQIDSGNGSRIDFGVSGSRNTTIYADANVTELGRTTNHPIAFKTNNTERMRILNGGGLQLAAGNNISNASGDFTLDVAGDITLDAGAENIKLHDDGTEIGQIDLGSANVTIRSSVQDKNTIFRGNDGGTEIEAMRIDYAEGGRVGIGTNSPAQLLEVNGNGAKTRMTRTGSAGTLLEFFAGATAAGGIAVNGSTLGISGGTGENQVRIDSSGNVGINESSPDSLLHVNSGTTNVAAKFESTDSIAAIQFTDSGGSAEIGCSGTSNTFYPNGALKMSLDSSGNLVASGNITAYGSPSDIKLKENIEVIDNALDKVKQLKGITYDLKSDGNRLTGLIAQDLEKVLPEAVYTAKDLEEQEHLAIRYGNTVGLLVEAIKELEARVKELEGK